MTWLGALVLIVAGALLVALTVGILHIVGIILAVVGVVALIVALIRAADSGAHGPRI